jgi:hypothetical protein
MTKMEDVLEGAESASVRLVQGSCVIIPEVLQFVSLKGSYQLWCDSAAGLSPIARIRPHPGGRPSRFWFCTI